MVGRRSVRQVRAIRSHGHWFCCCRLLYDPSKVWVMVPHEPRLRCCQLGLSWLALAFAATAASTATSRRSTPLTPRVPRPAPIASRTIQAGNNVPATWLGPRRAARSGALAHAIGPPGHMGWPAGRRQPPVTLQAMLPAARPPPPHPFSPSPRRVSWMAPRAAALPLRSPPMCPFPPPALARALVRLLCAVTSSLVALPAL